jgi:glycosyltransferase involved in cell wall biosynthesis
MGSEKSIFMRVLALSSYPIEAAATRFRIEQFMRPLHDRGIEVELSPFLDGNGFRQLYSSGGAPKKAKSVFGGVAARVGQTLRSKRYDLLLVQREAMPFGPGVFEWLYRTAGRLPLVLDLDDATYVPYESPTYGKVGSYLKFFGKTNRLIDRADLVICGNRFIAKYVDSRGSRSVVIPTVVDTSVFTPGPSESEIPRMGWIGTHSTFPFLERIFPILQRLATKHRFKLRIVGSGRRNVELEGVEVENLEWHLEREVADFRSLDIGLYPISVSASANDDWLAGKSGFKAVQYMAVGVPSVMSPVGVCGEMGEPGVTHLNAATDTDWYNRLEKLLSEPGLRQQMGERARMYALEHFSLDKHAEMLADALKSVHEKATVRS